MNIIKALMLFSILVALSFSSSAYDCYEDFQSMGKHRLEDIHKGTEETMQKVEGIARSEGVNVRAIMNKYIKHFAKFDNDETLALDKKIDEIDAKSGELNKQISASSGEQQCLERIALEKERTNVSTRKIEIINNHFFEKYKKDSNTSAVAALDNRLVGKWQGLRDRSSSCQFLAWTINLMPSGKFEVTFYSDKERSKKIATETGTWNAKDGKNELKTNGVKTPEVYKFTFVDPDTIKYVNTVQDPTADCQADYEFVERRVK